MKMDKLDRAIAAFEDPESDEPFSERINALRKGWTDNAFETMKFIKANGLKNPVSEDKAYIQIEGIKQFRIMEKMYEAELRLAARTGRTKDDIDADWLKKIKESPSTLGDIVRRTDEGNDLMKAV